jgi:hypothetical protein
MTRQTNRMSTGVINRCIEARPRSSAPLARAVMPALRAAPHSALVGVLAYGGFAFGGTGPEAHT